MTAEIGPQQRQKLCDLRWAPERAPGDDKVLHSLVRRGLACRYPVGLGLFNYAITIAGWEAICGPSPAEEPEPLRLEPAA